MVAIGGSALYNQSVNSQGYYSNTAVGSKSLYANTTGYNNSSVGYNTLLANTTGNNNTAAGAATLWSNTTGISNTGSGAYSLFDNTTGDFNTAVGEGALLGNTTGSNNTTLGYEADVNANNLTNATAIGANAVVNSSNKIRLGDGNVTVVESNAGSWTTSDGRFKNNVQENVKGLEFINLLRPVTYTFDQRKFQEFLMQAMPDSIKQKRLAEMDKLSSFSKVRQQIQTGFIAQEVAAAAQKIGCDFNGVHAPENSSDNWSMSYEKLTATRRGGVKR